MARTLRLAALAGTLALCLMTAPQPPDTGAYWKLEDSWTPDSTRTDVFRATAVEASVDVDHLAVAEDLLPVSNYPGARLTLDPETRLDGYLEINSIKATLVKDAQGTQTATSSENTLFEETSINVVVTTDGDCSKAADEANSWDIDGGAVGNFDTGSNVVVKTKNPNVITQAHVTPGTSLTVCPVVRPSSPLSTTNERRDFLNAHAGRQIRFELEARFAPDAPATWRAPVTIPPLVYTVAAPAPGAESEGDNCSSPLYGYGRLYWGWPNSDTDDATSTAAIDHWEIMRQDPVNGWKPFTDETDQSTGSVLEYPGSRRSTYAGLLYLLDSNWIYNDSSNTGDPPTPWVGFMIRGYLYPDDTTRYINSEVIYYAREYGNSFECGNDHGKPDEPNSEPGADAPGPHGLS